MLSSSPLALRERLAGVELLTQPTWVFDLERGRIVWANKAALALWQASSHEELYTRDFSDMSEATRTRNLAYHDAFRQGRSVEDEWTWYPAGKPLLLRGTFSGIELDDGRLGTLCEVRAKESAIDSLQLRGLEALRHTPAMVSMLDREGRFLMQNPAALRAFGEDMPFAVRFVDPEIPGELRNTIREGKVFRAELAIHTLAGPRWHALEARSTLDPLTGEQAILIHQIDISEKREREMLIDAQQRQILELSAPILRVGRSALAVPIIGVLDAARGAELASRLLHQVVEERAHLVLFDLTGADVDDAASAGQLIAIVRALELLGAKPILTGVKPRLAESLVALGISIGDVPIFRDLYEGLARALRA